MGTDLGLTSVEEAITVKEGITDLSHSASNSFGAKVLSVCARVTRSIRYRSMAASDCWRRAAGSNRVNSDVRLGLENLQHK